MLTRRRVGVSGDAVWRALLGGVSGLRKASGLLCWLGGRGGDLRAEAGQDLERPPDRLRLVRG